MVVGAKAARHLLDVVQHNKQQDQLVTANSDCREILGPLFGCRFQNDGTKTPKDIWGEILGYIGGDDAGWRVVKSSGGGRDEAFALTVAREQEVVKSLQTLLPHASVSWAKPPRHLTSVLIIHTHTPTHHKCTLPQSNTPYITHTPTRTPPNRTKKTPSKSEAKASARRRKKTKKKKK
jgi:hypothetical protein